MQCIFEMYNANAYMEATKDGMCKFKRRNGQKRDYH